MTYFEFLAIIENLPEPDQISINATGFSIPGNNAEIELRLVYSDPETDIDRKFKVEIACLEDYKIVKRDNSFVHFTNEHPVLWNFNSIHGDLYFNGEVSNPEKVFSDLYKVHDKLYAGLIPFESYFNTGIDVLKVLNAGSGLIAKGPVKILDCYAAILAKHGIKHSIIEMHEPKYWTGKEFVMYDGREEILLIGESYFVGNGFNFFEISKIA